MHSRAKSKELKPHTHFCEQVKFCFTSFSYTWSKEWVKFFRVLPGVLLTTRCHNIVFCRFAYFYIFFLMLMANKAIIFGATVAHLHKNWTKTERIKYSIHSKLLYVYEKSHRAPIENKSNLMKTIKINKLGKRFSRLFHFKANCERMAMSTARVSIARSDYHHQHIYVRMSMSNLLFQSRRRVRRIFSWTVSHEYCWYWFSVDRSTMLIIKHVALIKNRLHFTQRELWSIEECAPQMKVTNEIQRMQFCDWRAHFCGQLWLVWCFWLDFDVAKNVRI